MSGLPWYAHSIQKYERKTAHLSMLEHGAYRLMLDHYYKTAAPLPAKLEQVFRICRAVDEHEKAAATAVLNEFFELGAGGWHNTTADEELAKMADIRQKRSKAGSQRRQNASKPSNKTETIASANDPSNARSSDDANARTLNTKQSLEDISAKFEAFYAVFPRHVAKNAALKAYAKAVKRAPPEQILAGAKRYALERASEDQSFTKHPATWLNGDCWADESVVLKPNGHATNSSSFKPTDDDGWRNRLRVWREQQAKYPDRKPEECWGEGWGGPPGSPDCKAPPEIVAEFVH